MKIHPAPQGSDDWLSARRGLVTASEMDALVSPKNKVRTGEGVKTYLYRKLAEKIMNYAPDTGQSFAMSQGNLIEDTAVPWFEFVHGVRIQRVGLCISDDGTCAASPDGLIGDDEGIEFKAPQPPKHIEYLSEGVVPDDYKLQVQMCLYVSQRKRWYFVSYSSFLPKFVIVVYPDPEAQAAIKEALTRFNAEFQTQHAKITAMMGTGGRA